MFTRVFSSDQYRQYEGEPVIIEVRSYRLTVTVRLVGVDERVMYGLSLRLCCSPQSPQLAGCSFAADHAPLRYDWPVKLDQRWLM